MKVKLCSDGTIIFDCPGCGNSHGIPVNGSRGWVWNKDAEKPTVTPSILVYPHDSSPPFKPQVRCHSFITDGQIRFCEDSNHHLAGKTVNLPDME